MWEKLLWLVIVLAIAGIFMRAFLSYLTPGMQFIPESWLKKSTKKCLMQPIIDYQQQRFGTVSRSYYCEKTQKKRYDAVCDYLSRWNFVLPYRRYYSFCLEIKIESEGILSEQLYNDLMLIIDESKLIAQYGPRRS